MNTPHSVHTYVGPTHIILYLVIHGIYGRLINGLIFMHVVFDFSKMRVRLKLFMVFKHFMFYSRFALDVGYAGKNIIINQLLQNIT